MGRTTSIKDEAAVTVSVIGLGKLGSCYAAFCANHGFAVIGTDADAKKVDAINKGLAPVEEPNLQSYIDKNKNRLRAVYDTQEAVRASNATFIIVPTPSEGTGAFSLAPAMTACTEIGKSLAKKNGYHLVVLVSTVLPEDCRSNLIPAIERASGKKCGPNFGFCYSPSLIAIGDVLHNLEHPDFLFLGAFDKKSDGMLTRIYAQLYPKLTPEHMSIESGELAKIALNSYVTMKITFANTLGILCEHIPHADVDQITTALGKDKRIGSHYIKSGLGFGGPCFPRDNTAFAHMAARRGVHTPLARATDEFNKGMPSNIARLLVKLAKIRKTKCIGFLGISYKPNTTLTEDSQAFLIAKEMVQRGYKLSIYEPLNSREAEARFDKKARYSATLKDLLSSSDIIFISNRDEHFRTLPALLRKVSGKKIIVDPWRMFAPKEFNPAITYHAIGRSHSSR